MQAMLDPERPRLQQPLADRPALLRLDAEPYGSVYGLNIKNNQCSRGVYGFTGSEEEPCKTLTMLTVLTMLTFRLLEIPNVYADC
jgi:hypothetical protein